MLGIEHSTNEITDGDDDNGEQIPGINLAIEISRLLAY
jgi:hypothetical protein